MISLFFGEYGKASVKIQSPNDRTLIIYKW